MRRARERRAAANPRLGPQARELLLPDLVMRRPHGLYAERSGERTLLRERSLDNIGLGPAELHGARIGRASLRGRQRIYRRGGGRIGVAPGPGSSSRPPTSVCAGGVSPRRALRALAPRSTRAAGAAGAHRPEGFLLPPRSAAHAAVAPAPPASAVSRVRHLSAASADHARHLPGLVGRISPTYPEQWINVTGLRGCFAYVHVADPRNGISVRRVEQRCSGDRTAPVSPRRPASRLPRGDRGRPAAPSPY